MQRLVEIVVLETVVVPAVKVYVKTLEVTQLEHTY